MYTGSAMTGRRGLGICAMGALDMALWDLRGKVEGKPCWQLLGGAVNSAITPYASLLPEGDDLETYTRILVERAVEGEGARLPGGEARDLHQGAVLAQFAADRRRPRMRQDRRAPAARRSGRR